MEAAALGERVDDGASVEFALLPSAEIQRRLRALSEELDRLDQDPKIFARAFHIFVARSAYEALLEAASTLTNDLRVVQGPTVDLESACSSTMRREVLEF